MAETKQINLSLSNLKECIRARTMASEPGMGGIHVPYRRNKLTLLIKDVFEVRERERGRAGEKRAGGEE